MKRRSFCKAAIFAFATLAVGAGSAIAAEKQPNILFVMLDDMGYGDVRCFNPDSKIPTPNIDRLARDGMRFTDAHTAGGTCVPSRFGFLTGCYALDNRGYDKTIRRGRVTLASFLKDQGYSTGMVGKWHNGFWNWNNKDPNVPDRLEGGPHGCGFDYYFGLPHSLDIQPFLYIENDRAVAKPSERIGASNSEAEGWTKIQGAFWREGDIAPGFKHAEVLGKLTEKSIGFINEQKADKPFFLYVALTGPHTPWLPGKAFAGKSDVGMYGDFMMEIDDCIGRIFQTLEKTGAAENTLICLSSDNGPVWYPQDVEKFGHDSVGLLRGMKGDVFEGGHRVPFIASWPGKIPASSTCGETICLTDMMSTYAAVTGTGLPEGAGLDSVNLLPLMQGGNGPVRETTVHKGKFLGLRKGKYKYMEKPGSGGFSNVETSKNDPPQLYDLEKDLAETKNLYKAMPEKAAELKADLERISQ
jgi:arylsulfatase A